MHKYLLIFIVHHFKRTYYSVGLIQTNKVIIIVALTQYKAC